MRRGIIFYPACIIKHFIERIDEMIELRQRGKICAQCRKALVVKEPKGFACVSGQRHCRSAKMQFAFRKNSLRGKPVQGFLEVGQTLEGHARPLIDERQRFIGLAKQNIDNCSFAQRRSLTAQFFAAFTLRFLREKL